MFKWIFALFLCFSVPAFSAGDAEPLPIQLQDPSRNEISFYEGEDTDRFFKEFVRMLVILGVIIGGLLAVSWLVKRTMHTRIQQMNVSSAIKVLEGRAITAKSSVYLLEVHDHRILLGESANGLTLLASIPARRSFEEVFENTPS